MRPGPIAGMLACTLWLALQLAGWTPASRPAALADTVAARLPGTAWPAAFACDASALEPATPRLAVSCAYADRRPGRCTVSATSPREPRTAPPRCARPPAAG